MLEWSRTTKDIDPNEERLTKTVFAPGHANADYILIKHGKTDMRLMSQSWEDVPRR